jgi:hypothetical protein
MMAGTLCAAKAMIDAMIPMTQPIIMNHRRPKISERPPVNGKVMELEIVLAEIIQL